MRPVGMPCVRAGCCGTGRRTHSREPDQNALTPKEAYIPIELSQNVSLDSVGGLLPEALFLAGIPNSGVLKTWKRTTPGSDKVDSPKQHLNNFWYKARWGSLVSN